MNKRNGLLYSIITLLAVTLVGCTDQAGTTTTIHRTNPTVGALVVGVSDGRFAGACPGSDLDARNFVTICNTKSISSTLLINSQASFANVKARLRAACAEYDTVIFYFSGHGGQTKDFNPYADENDAMNEFLCLYDRGMLDNDVWQIISKAKGRVICIFDCCHSATMYRAPMFTDKIKFGAPIMTNFVDAVNSGGIFVIAGSPEDAYSYGSVAGGQLTNAIRRYYNNTTYAELFDLLENDKTLRSYQRPVCTIINNFDVSVDFLK